ncbi:MAG: AAA family ATPase, partial [Proteobacteria bacterium]|nr:AAA family ATPase [Pseudomonadota bacterium]
MTPSTLLLKKHLNLRIEIEGLRHQKILEIPELALREAIVNAVCHRDYFEKGANVMVEIYDDRLEITNPGGLPKTLKVEDFGKKSVCRNSIIASLLLRTDYIEKMGTGINRIKEALKEANCPKPIFEFDTFFTMTFPRVVQDKTTQETREKTREETSEKTSEKILNLLKTNKNYTISELSKNVGVTTRSIERNL